MLLTPRQQLEVLTETDNTDPLKNIFSSGTPTPDEKLKETLQYLVDERARPKEILEELSASELWYRFGELCKWNSQRLALQPPDKELERQYQQVLPHYIRQIESVKDKKTTHVYSDQYRIHGIVDEKGPHAAHKATFRIAETPEGVKRLQTISRNQIKKKHRNMCKAAHEVLLTFEPLMGIVAQDYEKTEADKRALYQYSKKQKAANPNADKVEGNSAKPDEIQDWLERNKANDAAVQ